MMMDDRMEENPPRVSSKVGVARKKRYAVDDGSGDLIECSGKYCRSCTAGMAADCVALCCCCPCAVLNILAFAFVKIPYMVGRRCLGVGKKKEKMIRRKCKKVVVEDHQVHEAGGYDFVVERNNNGDLIIIKERDCDDDDDDNARFEAEKNWLELYQIGHLDFGRVSFTGIDQSFGKGIC